MWRRSPTPGSAASNWRLVERGIFTNPMRTKIYVSLAHGDEQIDRYPDALKTAIAELRLAS